MARLYFCDSGLRLPQNGLRNENANVVPELIGCSIKNRSTQPRRVPTGVGRNDRSFLFTTRETEGAGLLSTSVALPVRRTVTLLRTGMETVTDERCIN